MYQVPKSLLVRWKSLESGNGLQQVHFRARVLWLVGLALLSVVVFGVGYGLHPIDIALAAAVMGWIIAERNALEIRLTQWPVFQRYIDWKRVEEELASDEINS